MLTPEQKETVKSIVGAGPESLREVLELCEDGLTKLARNAGFKPAKRWNAAKEFLFKALRVLSEE